MKKFFQRSRFYFICTVVCLLAACKDKPPTLTPLQPGDVIVAYGNSLTYGTGVKKSESYPAVLARLSGYRVVNAGVPGEVTKKSLVRLPKVLKKYHPKLVILCIGGNDLLRRKSRTMIADNVRSLVQMIQQSGAEVVLIAVPAPGVLLPIPDFYEKIAREYHVPFDETTLKYLIGKAEYKSDAIHLNKAGYRKLAESVYQLLLNCGGFTE